MFVAGFVGSPAMNFLPGTADGRTWTGPAGWSLPAPGDGSAASRPVTLGIRPHDLAIVPAADAAVKGRVDVVEPRGSELLVHLRLGAQGEGPELRVIAPPEPLPAVETAVGLRADTERLHWFDSATGQRLEAS
jgi:multiple sugar transport system ATP-binding protein